MKLSFLRQFVSEFTILYLIGDSELDGKFLFSISCISSSIFYPVYIINTR